MSRPFTITNKDGLHGHNALSYALELLAGKFYLAVIGIRPTIPTISTVTTINGNWTPLATTGLTNVLKWRISELNGNDFYYAFESVPGNNFSVGFGWVSEETAPTEIHFKRPGASNITLKLEIWKA